MISDHSIGYQIKFAFLPKRCHASKKLIWLKFAHKRTIMWTGPGEAIFEYQWFDRNEYLLWMLKR